MTLRKVARRLRAVAERSPTELLEEVKADVNAPGVIFERLSGGETLPQIARAWGVPKGRFVEWYTTVHAALYDTALKVRAADLALEALDVSDGAPQQAVGPDGKGLVDEAGKPVLVEPSVGRDKLRAATRQWFASRFDRGRYGEHSGVKVELEDKRGPVDRDAMVLETARAMAYVLAEASRKQAPPPRMLEAPVEVEVVPEKNKEEKIGDGAGII